MHYKQILLSSLFILAPNHILAKQDTTELDSIIVTANPLNNNSNEVVKATTQISGDELLLKVQPTIGETLTQELGIRSSYYGPNASRPVIRGLDGDQINILQNGVSNLDASANSPDHNIAFDPLSIEKIEVIRGASALFYGAKAVGGVVNLIDNRIPKQKINQELAAMTDMSYNSANNERSGSILLEGDVNNYAWHFNGFKRLTDNLEIPDYARSAAERKKEPLHAGESEVRNKLENSSSNTEGATFGVSRFFDKGYFGVAVTSYDSKYGVPGHSHEEEEEVNVAIDMKQKRLDFAGEYKLDDSYIKKIDYKIGASHYKHSELEGANIGTVFKNDGYDGRVEFTHKKIGSLQGVVGVQSGKTNLNVTGEEAFLPASKTTNNSIFILEELPLFENKTQGKSLQSRDIKLQIGARVDQQRIAVNRNAKFSNINSRDDLTFSSSLGVISNLNQENIITGSVSYTERAPNAQELYANGKHVATRIFEKGKQDLDVQRSLSFEVALRNNKSSYNSEINLFYNYFQDFIVLNPTGTKDSESQLEIYKYLNVPAEFYGIEANINLDGYRKNHHQINYELRGDYIAARNRKDGSDLPRIAPPRIGASYIHKYHDLSFRLDGDYHFKQNKTAAAESATEDYFMFNFKTNYNLDLRNTNTNLYLKVNNILDQEARNHVSFLKDEVPMSGRSIMIGIKNIF